MSDYFQEQDIIDIENASSFKDLLVIALRVLDRMDDDVFELCGPISTGPRTLEENLDIFHTTIQTLSNNGITIFNQIPFELKLNELKKEWFANGNQDAEYCMPLLLEFYLPIFESGKIKTFIFLPDWQESFGANWEREQAQRLGIAIYDLPNDWLDTFDIETVDMSILQ